MKNETLCLCSEPGDEPRDGLPAVDPTELPYLDDARGPSKGHPRSCKAMLDRRRT